MIAMTNNPNIVKRVVNMPRNRVPNEQLLQAASVNILEYKKESVLLPSLELTELPALTFVPQHLSSLWHCSYFFRDPTPLWSGYMHLLHKKQDDSFVKSSVFFLPIIDMPASNMSCLLSTVQYISDLANKHKLPAIITFDQPLFYKASSILHQTSDEQLKQITLLLGSFHSLMNLLGAIGTIMEGSGIENVLAQIYDESTVKHMMSGKAVSRALRGHFIVDYVLSALLLEQLPLEEHFSELEKIYCTIIAGESELDTLQESATLAHIIDVITEHKSTFYNSSNKTAELWLKYQKTLEIVRMLIFADRTGDWELHKNAINLAAAGHHNYIKSAYLYLQNMLNLETINPSAYE